MSELREQVQMGVEARRVFDNPAFVRALEALEEKYTRTWLETEPAQLDVREVSWQALRALRDLTDELTILLDNGTIAARQIEREEQRNG